MAKKRRALHDPELSVIHYQEQLEKMAKAYEKSATRRNQRAVNGFSILKQVQETVRDYLNQASEAMKKPIIAQLGVEFLGVAMAYLRSFKRRFQFICTNREGSTNSHTESYRNSKRH